MDEEHLRRANQAIPVDRENEGDCSPTCDELTFSGLSATSTRCLPIQEVCFKISSST